MLQRTDPLQTLQGKQKRKSVLKQVFREIRVVEESLGSMREENLNEKLINNI